MDGKITDVKNNNKTANKKILKIFFIICGVIIFIGIVGNKSSPQNAKIISPITPLQSQRGNVQTIIPTKDPKIIEKEFKTNTESVKVSDIEKIPNSYLNKNINFQCKVESFPKDSHGNVAALNCFDPNDFSSYVQVALWGNEDLTKINKDDIISIYGTGLGSSTGKNAFGADITAGLVQAQYLDDLTNGYSD